MLEGEHSLGSEVSSMMEINTHRSITSFCETTECGNVCVLICILMRMCFNMCVNAGVNVCVCDLELWMLTQTVDLLSCDLLLTCRATQSDY